MAHPLQALRDVMAEHQIDAYLIPTADFHGSEYVGEHFACREYISGFTGSAGTLLVFANWAGLWTDGRYFLQAAEELKGSDIRLMKQGEPGVPTIEAFLRASLQPEQTLGFDGRCVDARTAGGTTRWPGSWAEKSTTSWIWWARSGPSARRSRPSRPGCCQRNTPA